MQMLVDSAATIRWEICESELDASLREVRLIQAHRPKRNVASAFSFLYPLIGIGTVRQTALPFSIHARFVFTTLPQQFPGTFRCFPLAGSDRRLFSLMRLLHFAATRYRVASSRGRQGYRTFSVSSDSREHDRALGELPPGKAPKLGGVDDTLRACRCSRQQPGGVTS
jgi:hypothetical protein